jgi:hypothetical protein
LKIIGTTRKDVNESPIDFYSIGHVVFGYTVFFLSFWVSTLLVIEKRLYSLIVTILIGILWEILENTYLAKTKYKFDERKDSVENSLFDILFVFGGGVLSEYCSFLPVFHYIAVTFLVLIVGLVLMEVSSIKTLNTTENNE